MAAKKKGWGFDTKNIDRRVRPQDDFYRYANGSWIKRTKIPPEEASWGSFYILRKNTEHKLKTLIGDLLLKPRHEKGSDQQLVGDMYRSAMDIRTRNALGTRPLMPFLKQIDSIRNPQDLVRVLGDFHRHGIPGFWGAFIDQDFKNSERYLLMFWQGGLGLPERDYYLLDKPEQKRVREAYVKHIRRILSLAGYERGAIKRTESVVMRIETKLAETSMTKEDLREPENIYHLMRVSALRKLAPAIDWPAYFKATRMGGVSEVMVGQPEFFKAVGTMFEHTPLEELKDYMKWHAINSLSSLLSERFVKANFKFYGKALAGTKKLRPLWRRALGATNAAVGESVGKLYVKEYFPPRAKHAMDALVRDLFSVYAARIRKLDWMSSSTKKKALLKLRVMVHKIGYPSRWKGYNGLAIHRDDYFGNVLRSHVFEYDRGTRKLKRKVDRKEWHTDPQTVNAFYSPSMNEIIFPAGILGWPFFDLEADDAVNYGAIGSVIGHELTHGFDDSGAKFDGKGNMKNWWTPSDKKKFERKSKLIIEQADAHEAAPGVHMSGKLTLGENIADLGGVVIAWDALQKHLKKAGRKNIDGFSPEERFFFGLAQAEQMVRRPEYEKLAALTDPHAEASFRVNSPLSNFEPFYNLFGVKKGDKMYRDTKKRARIW